MKSPVAIPQASEESPPHKEALYNKNNKNRVEMLQPSESKACNNRDSAHAAVNTKHVHELATSGRARRKSGISDWTSSGMST
eukprot:COSAG01_NODE_3032_length_6694_cov_13.505231_1_plen_82_part_00